MNELTIEQALNNIAIALDKYVGTKQDHIILEQSFSLIKKQLTSEEVIEEAK